MLKQVRILIIILFLAIIFIGTQGNSQPVIPVAYSQTDSDESCAAMMTEALQTVGASCMGIGDNQVCYGHQGVSAELIEDANGTFGNEGEVIEIAEMVSLNTLAADPNTGDWGVAVLSLPSGSPDISGSGMTLVLLGEAEISTGDSEESIACTVSNPGPDNLNVRGGPSSNFGIFGRFEVGAEAPILGRNEAGDWVQIAIDDRVGWVYAPLLELSCDVDLLPIVDGEATEAPVQTIPSFQLTNGDSSQCEGAPDGLLVRAPVGQSSSVIINGVTLTVSGTGFVSAGNDGELTVNGLEGQIDIAGGGQSEVVMADFVATISSTDAITSTPAPIDPTIDRSLPALHATSATLIRNKIGIALCLVRAGNAVDYLTGPSQHFDVVGQLDAGQEILALRQSVASDETVWWQLANSGWIPSNAVQAVGDCSSLPGQHVLSTTVTVESPSPDEMPSCGVIWDAEKTNEAAEDGLDLTADVYFAEGTQVFMEAFHENGTARIIAETPSDSIVDANKEGEGITASDAFIVDEAGLYHLEGYSWGQSQAFGSVYAVAICP